MNHVYRIVWNAQNACWQAVSEMAKGRGTSCASCAEADLTIWPSGGANTAGEIGLREMVLLIAVACMGLSAPVFAGPEGGSVRAGNASINQSGTATTINQSSDRAVINWRSFSVGKDESVRFNQPSRNSATLNRVTGAERSDILGSLSANGHVFVLNPNGVLVGKGAQVNVGGFVASTLGMDDDDFMSGKINLKGDSEAAVTNDGDITAEEGGTVVLIAPEVNNNGTISAAEGSVVVAAGSSLTQGATTPAPPAATASTPSVPPAPVLATPVVTPTPATTEGAHTTASVPTPSPVATAEAAASVPAAPMATVAVEPTAAAAPAQIVSGGGNTADAFTVRLQDGSNIAFTIDKGAVNAMVNNGGLIKAPGGQVILTAVGRDQLSKATVNHSGVIEAQTLTTRNGVVELLADMKVGTVNLSGGINAAAAAPAFTVATPPATVPTLAGGFVETSAATVNVLDSARVTTAGQIASGIKTGTWLIDPMDFVIGSNSEDNISGAALGAALNSTDVTISTVPGQTTTTHFPQQPSGNGDIFVNDTVTWSANKLTLSAERDVFINQTMNASGAARLALEVGQGAVAADNTADYHVRMDHGMPANSAKVNLPEGENFSVKKGNDVSTDSYTVITQLGIQGDPSTTTLQGIRNSASGRFVLGADIDASATSGWNGGLGWLPIANSSGSFSGSFSGLGHQVNDLSIMRPNQEYVGLFRSFTADADVRDVVLSNVVVKGRNNVGGLVGFNFGTVSNSSVSGSISGQTFINASGTVGSVYVGGLMGNNFGTVSNSSATAAVSGRAFVGGLVGSNSGTVSSSNASGKVDGASSIGGLVGSNDATVLSSSASGKVSGSDGAAGGLLGSNGGSVSNSSASGEVSGKDLVGGLTGTNSGTVLHSSATGNVSGEVSVGGLVGSSDGTVKDSHSSGHVIGTNNVGGLVGNGYGSGIKNSHYNIDQVTINGEHRVSIGGLYGAQYQDWAPYKTLDIADYSSTLIEQADGRYGINSVQGMKDLLGFSGLSSNNFLLLNDLDLAPAENHFIPYLSGSFDGGGFTLSNLKVDQTSVQSLGLFGESIGSVSNTVLSNVDLKGGTFVGGLKGFGGGTVDNVRVSGRVSGIAGVGGLVGGTNGTVSNSSASASVYGVGVGAGDGLSIGGLVGLSGGTVSNSSASGPVSGRGQVGSLVGFNRGTVNNSSASGSVSGFYEVGGLVGSNTTGTVNSSSASGTVSGSYNVGGLVGGNQSGTIIRGNASGPVTGIEYVGGLVGLSSFDEVSYSSASGEVNGSDIVGGLVGYSSGGAIRNSYSQGSVTALNFAGGLIGIMAGGEVENTYSTSFVSAPTGSGGLVGDGNPSISSSYWSEATSGQSTSEGGTKVSAAQLRQVATYADWDFGTVWRIYEGQSTPVLRAFQQDSTLTASNDSKIEDETAYSGGAGFVWSTPTGIAGPVRYGGSSQGATTAGSYTIIPLVAMTQQDYQNWHVERVNGELTIVAGSGNGPGPGTEPVSRPEAKPVLKPASEPAQITAEAPTAIPTVALQSPDIWPSLGEVEPQSPSDGESVTVEGDGIQMPTDTNMLISASGQ